MIGTAAAILGSAVIGGAVSMNAASKASKAAKNAATQNNALLQAAQDRAYQTIDPYLAPGYNATNALSRIVGGTGYAAQANPLAASAGPDWNAYMAKYPDVAQRAQEGVAEGVIGPGKQWQTPQEWAAFHYQNSGQAEGRTLPETPAQTPAPTTQGNPTYGPQVAPRPVMSRPAAPTLDVSIGNYQQSPDYEFQLSEGNRNILAQKSRLGGLESGDALKDLQKYGQDVALGDYSQWRGYETGQRNFEASRGDQNFNVDSARSDAQYDADRGYLTSRFDTQVNDLFRLSGQGLNAAGTAINVGQNTANNMSGNNNSAASATGNAAIAGSNNVNALLGTALQTYGYMNGGYSGGTSGYGTPPKPINYTAPTSPSYNGQYVKL